MLERLFHLSEHKTNIQTEFLAGLTTFLTMAYIIFLNPSILSTDFNGQPTGLDFGAIILATCLISAFTTIFMGLFANYPIALAPAMGENFFFINTIMILTTLGFQDAWTVALGIVFISGILFLILSMVGVREALIHAVSPSMRNGIAVGIGLFITFIGFQNGSLIVAEQGTMVGLNSEFVSNDIMVFFFGLIVTSVLYARGIRGSILLGIIASSIFAFFLGEVEFIGILGFPNIESHAAFQMNLKDALNVLCIPFIIVFLFMDIFDTTGTVIGVAEAGDFIKDNKLPRANRVLIVDAVGTVGGACLGTSTVTSYIESITGIVAGGRTGLTSVFVGVFFLIALLFGPAIEMIGQYLPITAPALIIVGATMMQNVKRIDWNDHSESIPAFLMIVGIPFCYSIADGLTLGFICYPVIKLLSGRGKDVSWLLYFVALILLFYFIFVRAQLG